ncbi:MAG: thiol peroxidase [Bacteroidales bacterium]|nr:thiol peroxidase [Bacteroidales bacterium]
MERNNQRITFKGSPITLLGKEAKENDHAIDFFALDTNLKQVRLSDYNGKVKILSIFPSIDTSICSKQNHIFNKEAASLSEDIVIIAISNDLPFALNRFCDAENIDNLKLLSDHKDLDFASKYGFLIKELRLLTRGIIVIDKGNIIQHVEYVKEVTEEPNYGAAINIAKKSI